MKYFDKRLFLVLLIFMDTQIIRCQQNFYDDDEDSDLSLEDFNVDQPIQVQAGQEVRLKCGIRARHIELMESSEVIWLFKRCGDGHYNRPSCRSKQLMSKEWTKVNCTGNQPCKPTLVIKNSTENDSGLYLCKIHPYKTLKGTLQIQLVKTYLVDIINFNDFIDIDLPDSNVTVYEKSQVVLQCRVNSKNRPTIKWFRKKKKSGGPPPIVELTNSSVRNGNFYHVNTYISDYFQYFESNYELIESAGEKELSYDTFLSKLIINDVTQTNSGLYVCVGINYGGFKLKEAVVNVIADLDSNLEEELNNHTRHFNEMLFLFIIPILLAIGPIFYYTCYLLICRGKSSKTNQLRNELIVNPYKTNVYWSPIENNQV